MPVLNIQANQTNKDANTQFTEIQQGFQDTMTFSNTILTKLLGNYMEPINAGDEVTTSAAYTSLDNFSLNINVNNPFCLITFNLSLSGTGKIGVFVNNLLVQSIPFNSSSFSQIAYINFLTLSKGANRIQLQWQASTGTITKANSTANPGFNQIQIVSFNS